MPTISLTDRDGVVELRFERPVLARKTLDELEAVLARLAARHPPLPLVITSKHPTIFLAGAHLAEIAALDVESCVPYARLGRSVAHRLSSHPSPVVAAVAGSCSGGGFDLVLACDAVVASPAATFRHPGVLRGLVTGWGGTKSLPRALGRPTALRAFLEGHEVSAAAMMKAGVVVALGDDPPDRAVELALRLHRLHPSRLPLWRLLRGPTFVDRFRAVVVEKS